MRSPAAAVGWEIWHRHRWGLVAVASYWMVLAAVKLVLAARGQPVTFASEETFAFTVLVPMSAIFFYLLVIFSYGISGDLAACQSTYPARTFTLPISTAALVGWPMLYGTLGMAAFWLVMRVAGMWPAGVTIPWIWPAVLAATAIAWIQALTWMPYGLPGLRVVATVLALIPIDVVVFAGMQFHVRESVLLAILVPQLPLAYVAARFTVARARRGVVPDWRGAFRWIGRLADLLARPRRGRFASVAAAQAWFEWRRHGWSLPAWVAMLLPFELLVLFPARDAPAVLFGVLAIVLLTPPCMASFVAASVSRSNTSASDDYGLAPFLATRPLTDPALIAAKLRMAAWSTLATWLLVLVAIPLGLVVSDTWPMVRDFARRTSAFMGTPRAIVLLLVVLVGFMATTWKQLVQAMYVGLTGREWIAKSSVLLTIVFFSVLGPLADWILNDGGVRATLWDAIPLVLFTLVSVKLGAATWVAVRLHGSRLLSDRTLVVGAALWCAAVLALYGVFAWFFSTPPFPRYLLVLVAILAVPLARLSAAPLVLAWNRHR